MNDMKKVCLTIGLIMIVSIPLVPSYVLGWKQEASPVITRPNFTTHQWLAQEALKLSPSTSMIQWITNYQLSFWLGVEAPYNAIAASSYDVDYEDNYGDINNLFLYLDITGTTVTEGNLSIRAQLEYTRLITELGKDTPNEAKAAFHAGAMSHYISQAGLWGAIWNSTLWGDLNVTNLNRFESYIENTLNATYITSSVTLWRSNNYDLEPTVITPVNAEDATDNLAKNIHPVAESLGDDFDETSTAVTDWTTAYNDNVLDCLTYSVEAIYAALKHAMEAVNWKYISIPELAYIMNASNAHLTIPPFEVTYTDNTGTYNLTDTLATTAEYRIIVNPNGVNPTMQPDIGELYYNNTSGKWYRNFHVVFGLPTNRNPVELVIVYRFQMNGSALTWSNESDLTFQVSFYSVQFNDFDVDYNTFTRRLDIYNVKCWLPEVPELGYFDPTEVSAAQWFLYQKGEGTQTGETIGVPAYPTNASDASQNIKGDLLFDNATESWYFLNIDIGNVYTPTAVQYYVVIRFAPIGLPVGILRQGVYDIEFIPFAQISDNNWFVTRDHIVTITKPTIIFDKETQKLSAYGIRAWTDYRNEELDYTYMNKPVWGADKRAARWAVFLFDGIKAEYILKDGSSRLQWDIDNGYWFVEDIDVSRLPDNDYYIAASFITMNVNATASPLGPASDIFTITRPLPVVYYFLPPIFLIGFVTLFGWLVWYRPMMKKKRIEKDRKEKIDESFQD